MVILLYKFRKKKLFISFKIFNCDRWKFFQWNIRAPILRTPAILEIGKKVENFQKYLARI